MPSPVRRRFLRVLAALCIAAVPFVVSGGAGADSASSFGWWYQLNNAALPVPPPSPPNAPDGGIYVQNVTGVGHTAYGAVAFSSPGTTAGTVKFNVESVSVAPEIALCPTTSPWLPADAGVWGDRPTFDCAKGKVLGALNDDSTVLTFAVTDALSNGNGEYDLALVADPVADITLELAVKAPGGDFFTPTSTSPTTVADLGPPLTTSPPPPPADSGTTFGAPVGDDGGSSAGFDEILDEPTPETTAVDPDTGGGDEFATPDRVVSDTEITGGRIALATLLILAGIGLWYIGTQEAGDAHGGIARFARQRTGSPTALT